MYVSPILGFLRMPGGFREARGGDDEGIRIHSWLAGRDPFGFRHQRNGSGLLLNFRGAKALIARQTAMG
jgi:hypothetical protein